MPPFRVLDAELVAVDPRLTDDTTLWRYVDLPRFVDFLHYRRLFLSRGDQFLDKFEGQFNEVMKQTIVTFYNANPDMEFTYDTFRSTIREKVFVSCWHHSDAESMAMWTIYGRVGAVAMGTTVGRIRRAVEALNSPYLLSIEKVDYIDYVDTDDFDISPYSRIFAYKRRAYAYEQEVRLLLDKSRVAFNCRSEERGEYLSVCPQDFLTKVVVSPESPSWFFGVVSGLAEHYKLNIEVVESTLTSNPV